MYSLTTMTASAAPIDRLRAVRRSTSAPPWTSRLSQHALSVIDGGQAVVSEALRAAADVAAPAQLAETRQVVVVDVPQHDAATGQCGDGGTTSASKTLWR